MISRRFMYRGGWAWLIESAVAALRGIPGVAVHAYPANGSASPTGTLIVSAPKEEMLAEAARLILENPLFRGHFTPA